MYIAQKLKNENIIEYLLYMWQLEDILRACDLSIDIVNEKIINPQCLQNDERKLISEWHEGLIEMMIHENLRQGGHLQINKNLLNELEELHIQQLSGKDAAYVAKFYHILPFLTELRKSQNALPINDIELCFNFLYGFLMLRLQKKEISHETMQAKDEITKFMVLLAKKYQQYQSGIQGDE